MRVLKMAAAALMALGVIAMPASGTILPTYGGFGDHQQVVECGKNEYLAGLAGSTGSWVDNIYLVCAKVTPSGTLEPSYKRKDGYGGVGGSPVDIRCGPGELIVGVSFIINRDKKLRRVTLNCAPLTGGAVTKQGFGTAAVNAGYNEYMIEQPCPAGERATGFNIRYGLDVNALGLACQIFAVPAPPPPPKPKPAPPPVASAPAPPAPVRSFAGEWAATTNQNGHFSMVLEVDGSSVRGFFVNLEDAHNYDGVLTGTISGSTLTYGYKQPLINSTGTGTFTLSADGKSISGTGLVDDAAKTRYTWGGPYVPSFQGTWNTVTGGNGRFWLRFTIDGKSVRGSFKNRENAQFDGSLEGTLSADGKTIDFTYVQVGLGERGSGQFVLSADGRTFAGTGAHQPKAGGSQAFTWNGTR